MLEGKTVLLGVTGSIAAYKIASLASALKKKGANVIVLMTQNATNFINPITFETLTGNKTPLTGTSNSAWSMYPSQNRQTSASSPRQAPMSSERWQTASRMTC